MEISIVRTRCRRRYFSVRGSVYLNSPIVTWYSRRVCIVRSTELIRDLMIYDVKFNDASFERKELLNELLTNVRQAFSSEKLFLSPRRGSNPQPSDDRWDALTIKLPRHRWRAMVLYVSQKNSSCKTKRMNNFYSRGHSRHRRHSAYNVTQTIFTSEGPPQLEEWKKLLLKIEFNQRLQLF